MAKIIYINEYKNNKQKEWASLYGYEKVVSSRPFGFKNLPTMDLIELNDYYSKLYTFYYSKLYTFYYGQENKE